MATGIQSNSYIIKRRSDTTQKHRGQNVYSHLWCQSVVVCRLTGEQHVREAFLLPDHDVSESTVALVLSHVVPEPLVEHVAFLLSQLPLY